MPNWIDALPTVTATLLAVVIVHQFTKSRERTKTVYDLYDRIGKLAEECVSAACNGWTLPPGDDRKKAIAETKWRLQQLGHALVRLSILSRGSQWSWSLFWLYPTDIKLDASMAHFRRDLTQDPFEDPDRSPLPENVVMCEGARGSFLLALDLGLQNWIKPF